MKTKLRNGVHFILREKKAEGSFTRNIHWEVSCEDDPGMDTLVENFIMFLESIGYTKDQIIKGLRSQADEMS